MRSLRLLFSAFLVFGIGFFVCVVTPTSAFAESVEIRLDGYPLRIYENTTKTSDQLSQLNDSGTVNKVMRKYFYDDDSLSGLIDPDYSYTNPEIDRVYDYSVSLHDQNAYGYELLKSDTFPASSGAVANTFLGLYINFGSSQLAPGQKFRLIMPTSSLYMECYPDSTTTNTYYVGMSVHSVWTGNNENSLHQCTTDKGEYVVEYPTSQILVRLNTSGRNASRLNGAHSYFLLGYPRIIFDIPSLDSQVINEQSVTNTQNINSQSVTNTNSINNKITTETNKQTNALKDTTGSNTIVSGAINASQAQLTQKLGFVAQVPAIISQLVQALTSEGSDTIQFPGVSWQGLEIWEAQTVSITGYLPDSVESPIKTFNTMLLFLAWLHGVHLIYLRIVRPTDALEDAA